MKNITMTTTTTMNPVNYALTQLTTIEGQTSISLVSFKPDSANNDVTIKTQLMNCKLRNITNYTAFCRLLGCAFYTQQLATYEHKITAFETKAETKELTMKEITEKRLIKDEIIPALNEILDTFTVHEKAFTMADPFANMMAATLTGDFTICNKTASIDNVVKALADKLPTKGLQKAVSAYTLALTGSTDAIYNGYHLNCNAGLANDITKRYYKGRAYTKKGNVVQKYDTKGVNVRKEIALAIIEDLQNKATDKAKDNTIEAVAVTKK